MGTPALVPNPTDSPNPLLSQIRKQAMAAPQVPQAPTPLPPPQPIEDEQLKTMSPVTPQAQSMGKLSPRGTLTGEQNERNRLLESGTPSSHVSEHVQGLLPNHPTAGKILGGVAEGAARVGDTLLGAIAPGLASRIPGTEAHHQALIGRENKLVEGIGKEQETAAQTGEQQALTGLHNTQEEAARLVEISPEEAQSLGDPALTGQSVTQGAFQHLLTNAHTNDTKESTTNTIVEGRKAVAQLQAASKEKVAQLKPEQRDDRAIRLMSMPPESLSPDDKAYLSAYNRWIDETKVKPGVARAQAFAMFRPVQVIDPITNDVHYETAGNAIRSGASTPGSMNFKTAMAMAKFMTSGKGGNTLTAYHTAYDHLDMLQQAADALQNGDNQTLNKMSNSFKKEFGSDAPTNFDAVKAMLAGELANVAKVTGATDPEIATMKDQLSRASSPEQIAGVIQTNQQLMDQKAGEMFQQFQSGMQGQPNFGKHAPGAAPSGGGGAAPEGTRVKMADGSFQVKRGGKWVPE